MDKLEKRMLIYARLFDVPNRLAGWGNLSEVIDIYARRENLDPFLLRALLSVESSGRGRLEDGRPKILFEGHIFWRGLSGAGINPRDIIGYADVLYPSWTKSFYIGGSGEYERLKSAIDMGGLETDFFSCALSSVSWGSFQLMGFNFLSFGYSTIEDFVLAILRGVTFELESLLRFLNTYGMMGDLKAQRWESFARKYNGPKHYLNNYVEKLMSAYDEQLRGFEGYKPY